MNRPIPFLRRLPFLAGCLAACAEIAAPTGGPKDTEPPVLEAQYPAQEATGIRPDRIELSFDEFVTLKDATRQLLVSPPLGGNPEFRLRGKTVTVTWTDTLLEGRTYRFWFGDAIRDQNEGNILPNAEVVFSTGPTLDSLTLEGRVVEALTGEPEADRLVLLFPAEPRDAVREQAPLYATRSGEDGRYALGYLAPGRYRLVALGDNNFNYRFDLPNEAFAFAPRALVLDSPGTRVDDLRLFTERAGEGELLRVSARTPGTAVVTFRGQAAPERLRWQPASARPRWNPAGDTLTLWTARPDADSLVVWQDTDSVAVRQATALPRQDPDSLRRAQRLGVSGSLPLNSAAKGAAAESRPVQPLHKPLILRFARPVESLRPERLSLRIGDSVDVPLDPRWIDSAHTRLRLAQDWVPAADHRFTALPGAFEDLWGLVNDTVDWPFRTQRRDAYGRLTWRLTLPDSAAYVVQLLDASDRVLEETAFRDRSNWTWDLPLLPAGSYRLRLIEDANANGTWDPGRYDADRQPERVVQYPETASLRADWTLEFDWTPSFEVTP